MYFAMVIVLVCVIYCGCYSVIVKAKLVGMFSIGPCVDLVID